MKAKTPEEIARSKAFAILGAAGGRAGTGAAKARPLTASKAGKAGALARWGNRVGKKAKGTA